MPSSTADPEAGPSTEPAAPRQSRAATALEGLALATWHNPILVKEFRSRMRGSRAYWILFVYTGLLAAVLGLWYFAYWATITSTPELATGRGAQDLGRGMYYFVFIAQAVMTALITPGITAGTITIEREQRSYELLVTTPLRGRHLIFGKLSAAVSFVVLLLTASLPLVSISFLVGGVAPEELFFSYLILIVNGFLCGAVGIFWSSALRSTAMATVVAYLTVLTLFLATMVVSLVAQAWSMSSQGASFIPLQSVSPVGATLRAVQPEWFLRGQLPAWVGGLVINVVLGVYLMLAAEEKLEHFNKPSAWLVRLWATLAWTVFAVFLFSPILGHCARAVSTPQAGDEAMATLCGTFLAALLLLAPVLNTGDLVVSRGESALRRYLAGLLPHRMFRRDLPSGAPLLILWAAIPFGLILLNGGTTAAAGMTNLRHVFLPAAIMSLAVLSAVVAMGHYLSIALPSRWTACALTYLGVAVLMVVPYSARALASAALASDRPATLLFQPLYLFPWSALHAVGNPADYLAEHPRMLLQGVAPHWLVTSALYSVLAAIFFGLTLVATARAGRRLRSTPPLGAE